jgi:hypothetical protein
MLAPFSSASEVPDPGVVLHHLAWHEKEKVMRQQTAIRTVMGLAWLLSVTVSLPARAADVTGSGQNVASESGAASTTDITASDKNVSHESVPARAAEVTESDHNVAPESDPARAAEVTESDQNVSPNPNSDGERVNVGGEQPDDAPVVPTLAGPAEEPRGAEIPPTVAGESSEGPLNVVPKVLPEAPPIVLPEASTDESSVPKTPAGPSAQPNTKDFIVKNYDGIVKDLRRGAMSQPGEHMAALLSLLRIPITNEYDAIKRILALSVAYPDIPQFADHVIEAFGR